MDVKGFKLNFYLAAVIGLLFFAVSCSDDKLEKGNVLTHPQMTKALIEIYLAEQKVNRFGLPRDSAERHFQRLKPVIFEKIGVGDSLFKRSFDYYMDRPKEMEIIYTAVVDSLSLMEQRLQAPAQ
jgi:hypothetical protein